MLCPLARPRTSCSTDELSRGAVPCLTAAVVHDLQVRVAPGAVVLHGHGPRCRVRKQHVRPSEEHGPLAIKRGQRSAICLKAISYAATDRTSRTQRHPRAQRDNEILTSGTILHLPPTLLLAFYPYPRPAMYTPAVPHVPLCHGSLPHALAVEEP